MGKEEDNGNERVGLILLSLSFLSYRRLSPPIVPPVCHGTIISRLVPGLWAG